MNLSHAGTTTIGSLLTVSGGTLNFFGQNSTLPALAQSNSVLTGTGKLTVSGAASFSGFTVTESGSGSTVLQGASTLNTGAALYLDGGRVVENQGSLAWGGGQIELGSLPSGNPVGGGTLVNDAGATIDAQANDTVNAVAGATAFDNAGLFQKSAGTGVTAISAPFTNTGTVEVDTGTLLFQKSVDGTGAFNIDGATVLDFATQVTGNAQVSFVGVGGTIEVDNPGTLFGGSVSGFALGDTIDFTSEIFTQDPALTFNAGTLTVNDGVHSESIPLLGSYSNSSFNLAPDAHAGTAVLHT